MIPEVAHINANSTGMHMAGASTRFVTTITTILGVTQDEISA